MYSAITYQQIVIELYYKNQLDRIELLQLEILHVSALKFWIEMVMREQN